MKGLRQRATALRDQLQGRYVGLATRERVLVTAAGLALMGFTWDFAFHQSAEAEHAALDRQVEAANAQLKAQLATAAGMRDGGPGNELAALRLAVSRQRTELQAIQGRLQARVAGFVPPDQTERLLEDVLSHHPGMRLLSAEVLPAEPIQMTVAASATPGRTASAAAPTAPSAAPASEPASGSQAGTPALYRHGMRLELSGGYLEALEYLHELERMPWGLAWDRVDYQVEVHPKGRLILELHTISDREEWVGA